MCLFSQCKEVESCIGCDKNCNVYVRCLQISWFDLEILKMFRYMIFYDYCNFKTLWENEIVIPFGWIPSRMRCLFL